MPVEREQSVFMNDMSETIDRITDRLGMRLITLPKPIAQDKWPKIIIRDSLSTFSRYFPHKMTVYIDTRQPTKGGWYLVNHFLPKGVKLIGIGDIEWAEFGHYAGAEQSMGYGAYDFLSQNFGLDDVGLLQMRADHMSMFLNTIFVKIERPNKVKFQTSNNRDITKFLNIIPLEVMVKNFDDLSTISPGMMEIFEDLCSADIATFLFNQLKFYDGLENLFGSNIDLKLQQLEEAMGKREEIVQKLQENQVSAGNKNYRFVMAV